MMERLKQLIAREGITWSNVFNPFFMLPLLFRLKYIHFFITGITGVAIGLGVTWILTESVYGKEHYFTAYLIGIAANLIYNFTLHTIVTFRTRERHFKRFAIFIVYSLAMAAFQAYLVKIITPIFGVKYYLLVIAGIIFLFSTVSFVVFKLALFNEKNEEHSSLA